MVKKLPDRWIKIMKTCNLYLSFLLQGLCMSFLGPCLLELQHLVQTDTQHIAFIITARSIGNLCGTILGGVLLDAIKSKQGVLTMCNFITALTMIGAPWCRNLGSLIACIAVNGLVLGTIDTGGNVMCLTLWGSGGGPMFQALHFAFGLGGFLAPLIAAPYLNDYSDDHTSNAGDNSTYTGNLTNSPMELEDFASLNTVPSITYPFSIIGGFGLLVTLMFLAVTVLSPFEEEVPREENSQQPEKSLGFLSTVILLNFLFIFVSMGMEFGYAQLLTTYVVKGRLQLSSSTGSFMTSTFFAAFTASRLASIFLAMKVSNFALILCDLVACLVGSSIFLFFASQEWSIWTASAFLGMGISSMFPSAIGWVDAYVDISNKIASVFTAGASFGGMLIPFVIGYFIDSDPDVILYTVFACSISCTLLVFILYLILRKNERENAREEQFRPPVRDSSSTLPQRIQLQYYCHNINIE